MALPTEILLSVSHISRFILASMPVENSSMSITGGFPGRSIVKYGQCSSYNNNSIPISAIAKDSFRWFPPDSLLARRSAYCFKEVASIMLSTLRSTSVLRWSPFSRPYMIKCSRTVNWESIAVNCGQTPNDRRASLGRCTIENPLISASPASGMTSPPRHMWHQDYTHSLCRQHGLTDDVKRSRFSSAVWP